MSLIDQALKKTQLSLNKQKTEAVPQPEPIAQTPQTQQSFSQQPRNPLQQKRLITRRIPLPGFNKYIAFSLLGLILLILSVFIIHANYAKYPISLTTLAHPLSLDGTMEMDNERVALINGHLYHKGEIIEGYRITQIHYNDILLQDTDSHQSITLMPKLAQ